MLSKSSKKRED